jgi:hypothetical protein
MVCQMCKHKEKGHRGATHPKTFWPPNLVTNSNNSPDWQAPLLPPPSFTGGEPLDLCPNCVLTVPISNISQFSHPPSGWVTPLPLQPPGGGDPLTSVPAAP